jgi:hypothetical protein
VVALGQICHTASTGGKQMTIAPMSHPGVSRSDEPAPSRVSTSEPSYPASDKKRQCPRRQRQPRRRRGARACVAPGAAIQHPASVVAASSAKGAISTAAARVVPSRGSGSDLRGSPDVKGQDRDSVVGPCETGSSPPASDRGAWEALVSTGDRQGAVQRKAGLPRKLNLRMPTHTEREPPFS